MMMMMVVVAVGAVVVVVVESRGVFGKGMNGASVGTKVACGPRV